MKILNPVKNFKDFLLFIWQLPQNLIGIAVIQLTKAWYSVAWKDCYFTDKYDIGVSLGDFIIVSKNDYNNTVVLWHERGHQKQSQKYGWFYLLIVGLPSITRNIWDRIAHKKWSHWKREKWYYSHFPEKQADELGGVKRFGGK